MGALGMLLATIGLFGVMSYAVTSRRQEIGMRMALGATRARVLGTVLRSGLTLVGLGGLAGLGLSLIAPRPLAPFLAAGVAPTDPWSLAAVCALVAAGGAAASLGPAWRASRLDPMRTLRCD
jgi:ABC-type antimicrobial peptide transport system permease subunit